MALAEQAKLGLSMRFSVSISSYELGSWMKVEGLKVSWEVCEYRAGDAKNLRWYFPGYTKYETIKLSRAACKDDTDKVKAWLNSNSFKTEVQVGSIELRDSTDTAVATWDLNNVMPVMWNVSGFDATANKVAIETLELAHLGFLTDE